VALVGSAKSAALVEVVRDGSALDEASAAVRADARARLARAIGPWSARSAAVATAILIGDRTGLPAEDERRLQEAGTYHVIAISGGNIAILAGLLLVAARALRLPSRAAASATILVLLFYGQVAGGAPSVGRAVTAAVIFLGARAIDHRGRPLNALGVAAGFAVARAPAASLDPGFILSFGATLGILAGTPALLVPPAADRAPVAARRMRAALRPLAALLAATVCAEIALAPAGASLFSRITFAGLLLNFAAIPLMTLVQIAAAAVLAFSRLWPGAAHACAYVAHLAATGLVDSARLVDAAPWLSIEVRPPAAWLIVVYYAAAGALVWFRRLAAAWVVAAAGMLLVLGPAFVARDQLPPRAGTLRVVVLDVGQGDATLVNLPDGRTLLVDAGGVAAALQPGAASPGGFDTGDRVVRPALRALGVRRLDALVITHGDPDHILGVPSVLQRVGARSVWEGAPVPPHAGLQAVAALAAARGASWRTVQAGDRERFGGADVRVLHPPPPDWERQRVRNEDSVVLELRLGSVSIVLPGDIGAEGERAILPRLERGRLVVLKAPHHGSATSSSPALLDVLRPAAAIFSAGRDNRFGHPHPAVVARYRALGTALFGTAEDGAVIVETDGTKVQVRGWTGRVMEFTK
jgi:competence protein ComEC